MSSPVSLEEQLEKVKKDLKDANETIAMQQIELDSKDQELTEMQGFLEDKNRQLSDFEEQSGLELRSRLAELEDDLQMVELLCWLKNVSIPSNIPADALSQIVWLEANLLEKIRRYERRDSWFLLAFGLLSNMVVSNDWPACCIAAVRLAVLAGQYPLRDKAVWDDFVANLMNNFIQLDVDPLGQACLAYLCLTTRDPPAMMAQNLPVALSQAEIDVSMRIPEILAKLEGEDVAVAHDAGSLSVVFVRRNQQSAVFSRLPNSSDWSFSVLPFELTSLLRTMRRIS
ncbi:hypothetical protein M436DRAFT_86137 [Aureobasidium namibiae CBS 147.97]|uniref:Uncharacterized protein n=1 Tax=Aureobasidium namibiae CBS 147.97 TaxID=1043004 RepID=A0A074W7C2_9PEZI